MHEGNLNPFQDTEEFDWCLLTATQGDSVKQNRLGRMYQTGQGVSQDYAAALNWYHQSADQGNSDAQYNLGAMCEEGQGVPKDYSAAVGWYRLAVAQGHSDAQNNLGLMYFMGDGVPQDYSEALKWYRQSANQGNCSGQYNLGVMYEGGHSVLQDDVEAMNWFSISAKQGDPDAQYKLGVMYEDGQGCIQDQVMAHVWYNIACANGNIDAADARDNIGAYLTRNEVAESQSKARDYMRGNYEDAISALPSAFKTAKQIGDMAVQSGLDKGTSLMNKKVRENPKLVAKAGIGMLGVMFWCSTGGLMFLHFISFFMGATSLLFAIIGFFVPPIGLVNGLVFIVTGGSLQQYF